MVETVARDMRSHMALRVYRVGLVLLIATGTSGCLDPTSSARVGGSVRPAEVGFCRLVAEGRDFDKRIVRVRSRFGAGAEHVRLFDSECPESSVFAVSPDGRVDITLCRTDKLAVKFGCPVDGESGVRATFTGMYHFVSDGVGRIDVRSMTDVSR